MSERSSKSPAVFVIATVVLAILICGALLRLGGRQIGPLEVVLAFLVTGGIAALIIRRRLRQS